MKKVLVLAGGYDQIFLIEELKRRNMYVILADYLDNPPAKNHANKFIQESTLNEKGIYDIAKNEKVDYITTACTDQALMTVASVSERLGLPCYISSKTAREVTDKTYMKTIFADNNIPTADFCIIYDVDNEEINENLAGAYPLVVKPCDCNSSKGISKVYNDTELKVAIKEACSLSRTGKAIVEKYITGKEITIDVWNDAEGSKVISISEIVKVKQNDTCFTICQNKYPAYVDEEVNVQVQGIASAIAKAFVLKDCPMLIQAFVDENNKVYVGEFSARMGGGSKHIFIKYMAGIDIMKEYVDRILGEKKILNLKGVSDKCYTIDYIYSENGTFDRLTGVDKFLGDGNVLELFEYKQSGAVIEKRTTSSDRIAGLLIGADSEEMLADVRKKVFEAIDVIDKENKSIFYRDYWIK